MEYKVIRSNRKTVAISVLKSLEVTVRAPIKMPESEIERFVYKNEAWIKRAVEEQKKQNENTIYLRQDEVDLLYKKAKEILPKKVEYFADVMGVKPTKVTVNHAKKRFGSCTGKNALNFSVQLMAYPEEVVDYVVVHELAHIKHHNHSKAFYAFVEKIMPDYKRRRQLLYERTVVF